MHGGLSRGTVGAQMTFRNWRLGAVVLVSTLLGLAFATQRIVYDDELVSYELINKPLAELWRVANHDDVHPPLMYALGRLLMLSGLSPRLSTLLPLFIANFGLLYFCIKLSPLFSKRSSWLLLVGLCLVHPQWVLWTHSIRWYPYWSGLALGGLGILIDASRSDRFKLWQGVALGICISGMLYFNYLTMPWIALMGLVWLLIAPANRASKKVYLVGVGLAALAFLPQIEALRDHLGRASSQVSNPVVALARLLIGLSMSDAMLPWTVLALMMALLVCVPLVFISAKNLWGSFSIQMRPPLFKIDASNDGTELRVFLLLGGMIALAAVSGLGAKARSFVALVPLMIFVLLLAWERLKSLWLRRGLALVTGLWLFFAWSHLLGRYGLAKASLNDRPEEVVELIRSASAAQRVVVVTRDPALSYAVNKMAAEGNLPWIAWYSSPEALHRLPAFSTLPEGPQYLFVVESYIGADREIKEAFQHSWQDLRELIREPKSAHLSLDPDYESKLKLKRILPEAADLPRYRFEVVYGKVDPLSANRALSINEKQIRAVQPKK